MPKEKGTQMATGATNTPPHVQINGKIDTDVPAALTEYQQGQIKSETREDRRFFVEIGTLLFVICTAGFAFWQGCSAKESADAGVRAAKAAELSLTDVQRPFIYFAGGAPAKKIILDKKLVELDVNLPWENSGATPTVNGDSQVNWKIFPLSGMPPNFSFADEANNVQKSQFEIPPKGVGNTTLKIPTGFLAQVAKGQQRLYVWGWITYSDIFTGTPTRLSEFCDEVINVKSTKDDIQDPNNDVTWDLTLCSTHNCSDERCADYYQKTQPKLILPPS